MRFKMGDLEVNKNKKFLIWLPLIAGLIFLFTPTYIELYNIFWSKDEQGHGPLVLMIALFLFWQKKELFLKSDESKGNSVLGWSLLFVSLIIYILAKWQYILVAEVAVQIPILISIILITSGYSVLNRLWFPLFFSTVHCSVTR